MRLLGFLFLLSGCSSHPDDLQFNLVTDSVQLDWNKANDSGSIMILDNIMEGLTSYSGSLADQQGDHLRPLPALAKSWAISQEGRLYRFHIREGVQWSDGIRLTAQHFVDSVERLLEPSTRSRASYQLFAIEGAQEFADGKVKDFAAVGVKAISDKILEIRLKRAAPYLLHLFASPVTFPVRTDLIKKFGSNWVDPQNLVTLGAYRIKEWRAGEYIKLKANQKYWAGQPAITEIKCKMVTESLTALALYENGELDVLPSDLPPAYYSHWASLDDYRTGAKLSVAFLTFNTRKAPFTDASSRRAFAQLIHREEMAKFFQGSQSSTNAIIPPGMFAHMPGIGISYSPPLEKLRAWPPLLLKYNETDSQNLMFQWLQNHIEKIAKVNLRLEPTPWKEYSEFLTSQAAKKNLQGSEQPHLFHVSWVADFPDPHSFMNLFTSSSEHNLSGWRNARYDALVEAAVLEEEEQKRMSYYQQAQRILLEEEAVIAPLFFSSHQALVKANIKGVVLNPLDKWYFKNFRFEE